MATEDIQGFSLSDAHDVAATVIQLDYVRGGFIRVVMSNDMLPALIEALLTASDQADAAAAGVAVGVMSHPEERRTSLKVEGEPINVLAHIVDGVSAHVDAERCVVLTFDHGRYATVARTISEGARLMAAQAAGRIGGN
jgi:hypothetical protein